MHDLVGAETILGMVCVPPCRPGEDTEVRPLSCHRTQNWAPLSRLSVGGAHELLTSFLLGSPDPCEHELPQASQAPSASGVSHRHPARPGQTCGLADERVCLCLTATEVL